MCELVFYGRSFPQLAEIYSAFKESESLLPEVLSGPGEWWALIAMPLVVLMSRSIDVKLAPLVCRKLF
jgi:hypothetical protein